MGKIRDMYKQVFSNSLDKSMQDISNLKEMLGEEIGDELTDLLNRNVGDKIKINSLSYEDYRTINKVIRNINHAISMQDQALANKASISEIAHDITGYSDSLGEIKVRLQGTSDFLRLDQLKPYNFFQLLGKGGSQLWKGIRKGLNTRTRDIRNAIEFLESTKEATGITKQDMKEITGKSAKVEPFHLRSGDLFLTHNQIMSLYESAKQEGFFERSSGGITVDVIPRKGVGNDIVQRKPVRFSEEEFTMIISKLSAKEKAFADALQQYMANECAKQGNEVSNAIYGYEAFTNPQYFPYFTDSTFRKTSDKDTNPGSMIISPGFTHQRIETTVPLKILGITDAFANHVAEMANYHANKAATKDIKRVLDYQELVDGEYVTNTKLAIGNLTYSTRHDGGLKYIEKLLADIEGQSRNDKAAKVLDKLSGNLKGASVMANLNVIVQQPSAYFRALNCIDAKYLLNPLNVASKKEVERVQNLSDVAWWKSQGYYDVSIGPAINDLITGDYTPKEIINKKAGSLAGLADDYTWATLYRAVEREQRAETKKMGLSEEEFRERVNDRFDDIIDQTQVIDTNLHKSQFMRSADGINKLQTAFMAEPTTSYNMLFSAAVKDLRDGNAIPKNFMRATAAFTTATIVNTLAQSLIEATRAMGRDDDWDELYWQKVLENFANGMMPANMIPWVKSIWDTMEKVLSGDKTTSTNSRYDLDGIQGMIENVNKVWTQHDKMTPYGVLASIAKPTSQVFGLPAYSLMRDLSALYNVVARHYGLPALETKKVTSTELKKSIITAIEKDKTVEEVQDKIDEAMEREDVTIFEIQNRIKSNYKNDYYEAVQNGDTDTAKQIGEYAAKGLTATGMSDDEADEEINSWAEEAITYKNLDNALTTGEGISEAVNEIRKAKETDNIVEHIMDRYESTIEYERSHKTNTIFERNVNTALELINPDYDYDNVKEEMQRKAEEKEAKAEADAEKSEAKEAMSDAIRTGGDYKTTIDSYLEIKEASKVKSDITSTLNKEAYELYVNGDKDGYNALKNRVIQAKAYVDSKYKPKIAKKYNGNYTAYEKDEWNEWFKKQQNK